MDHELKAWTEQQTLELHTVAAEQQRLADAVGLLSREVANLAITLAPRQSDGPSPLEQLLAQMVAQGQEQLHHLRNLTKWAGRMESEGLSDPRGRLNGNGKANGRNAPS